MSLSLANPQPAQMAQFKPCVWPNVCNEISAPAAQQIAVPAIQTPAQSVAQFKPCVWPNVCKTEAPVSVAQFKPCVWPNVCKEQAPVETIEVAQFTTCVYPKKCGKAA